LSSWVARASMGLTVSECGPLEVSDIAHFYHSRGGGG
jgi:hypothetical protein